MNYDKHRHRRRSIRLKGYDYSKAGTYFVTICAQNRECLFGNVVDREMRLNDVGCMIQKWWHELVEKFENIEMDKFVIMPNHFHGIIVIVGAALRGRSEMGQPHRVAPTLGDVVGWFKTMTTNEYIGNVERNNWPRFNGTLWQRNYYEHIIRDEEEIGRIRKYIIENPLTWAEDENNPANVMDCRGGPTWPPWDDRATT